MSSGVNTIKAVLFDADGVLQTASADLTERLATVFGHVPDDLDAFFQEIFAAEMPAIIDEADFATTLAPVLRGRGSTCDALDFISVWSSITICDPILSLVRELRISGIYCAIASNQQRYRATHMSCGLGYREEFDSEFYSYRLGVAKPEVAYFESILESLPYAGAETLFIDDRLENVIAASKCGLRAEQFALSDFTDPGLGMRELLGGFGLLCAE